MAHRRWTKSNPAYIDRALMDEHNETIEALEISRTQLAAARGERDKLIEDVKGYTKHAITLVRERDAAQSQMEWARGQRDDAVNRCTLLEKLLAQATCDDPDKLEDPPLADEDRMYWWYKNQINPIRKALGLTERDFILEPVLALKARVEKLEAELRQRL